MIKDCLNMYFRQIKNSTTSEDVVDAYEQLEKTLSVLTEKRAEEIITKIENYLNLDNQDTLQGEVQNNANSKIISIEPEEEEFKKILTQTNPLKSEDILILLKEGMRNIFNAIQEIDSLSQDPEYASKFSKKNEKDNLSFADNKNKAKAWVDKIDNDPNRSSPQIT